MHKLYFYISIFLILLYLLLAKSSINVFQGFAFFIASIPFSVKTLRSEGLKPENIVAPVCSTETGNPDVCLRFQNKM